VSQLQHLTGYSNLHPKRATLPWPHRYFTEATRVCGDILEGDEKIFIRIYRPILLQQGCQEEGKKGG